MRCMKCGHLAHFHADSDRLRLVGQRFCYVSWCQCQDFQVMERLIDDEFVEDPEPTTDPCGWLIVDGEHCPACLARAARAQA